MSRGFWLKAKSCLKILKDDTSKQVKIHSASGSKGKDNAQKVSSNPFNGLSSEDIAAIRIQTAFRTFMERKKRRRLIGAARFHNLIKAHSVKKQASITLSYIHIWSRIQSQINARRLYMVTEGRCKQKKMENQLKLEAKLQELEVEWNGGSETMEEIHSKIQQREEASIKRERAMAYAFSHQWKANNSQYLGQAYYTISKDNWGWSWKERWIAARPWEVRIQAESQSSKRSHSRQASKVDKVLKQQELKLPMSIKPALSHERELQIKGKKLTSSPTIEEVPVT
ncbi:hypothetical protein CFOL_v3_07559 [Cephalotus follicularis]|uniref:IQ domain-containing protein/DUF4005 domain-containing protein n=1 Tax=Cephalotus follicularis TaxID=3775 RepID=A0A1Q3B7M1_CEPFO|nr:hypothetical protein CFOL_v3_07559 [Cephalotus follicularis]